MEREWKIEQNCWFFLEFFSFVFHSTSQISQKCHKEQKKSEKILWMNGQNQDLHQNNKKKVRKRYRTSWKSSLIDFEFNLLWPSGRFYKYKYNWRLILITLLYRYCIASRTVSARKANLQGRQNAKQVRFLILSLFPSLTSSFEFNFYYILTTYILIWIIYLFSQNWIS